MIDIKELEYEFDHVGIAVESIDKAAPFYKEMGLEVGSIEEVTSEKVRVQMFELGNNSRIELLEATAQDSPIAKFLQKRGPGIHHICLRVNSVHKSLKILKESGYNLIHEEPFRGAHNCQVAFVHPKSTGGVLLELSQPER